MEGQSYKKIIIIGPSHYFYLKNPTIPDYKSFKTPLGLIKIWSSIEKFRKEKIFIFDNIPHNNEHCIEVELPFIQTIFKDPVIIPILMSDSKERELSNVLKNYIDDDTLIIVSSDLSHYYKYEEAKKLDNECINAILKNDIFSMYKQEACGKYPIITLMHLAKYFGWKAQIIDMRNSGDTSGSKDRVVGYASIAFYDNNNTIQNSSLLTDKEKSLLLSLARQAIIKKDKNLKIDEKELTGLLKENSGCFVTLTIDGNLRGCIGYIKPVKPLYQAVIDNAYNAAYSDYRFNPVSDDEIKKLNIEISILTNPQKLDFTSPNDLLKKITPDKDGVIISKDRHSATFLPQVWEKLPDKIRFLEELCLKAGLNKNAWQEKGFNVEIYRVKHFKE